MNTQNISLMTKELVQIEFRYNEIPKSDLMSEHATKTITVGIYNTIDEAVAKANDALETLAKTYKIRNRFKVKSLFGMPDRLVVDEKYSVFVSIKKLVFDDIAETIKEVTDSNAKYAKWRNEN